MYRIESIELDEYLTLQNGREWYRYIISDDFNQISCLKPGTRQEVTDHAVICIRRLNLNYKKNKPYMIKAYKPVHLNSLVY